MTTTGKIFQLEVEVDIKQDLEEVEDFELGSGVQFRLEKALTSNTARA